MVSTPRLNLSVFFPCHNEQGNIERLVHKALEVLPTVSDDFEIIIVDDGSTDDTPAIADRLAAENPRVRVVHHPSNRGYGGALQSGFRAATKDWVFYTDGDGQFDLGELPEIAALSQTADVVSCYRLDRKDSALRKLNAWAWGLLVRMMFDLPLRDIDCAFKLYRREVFDGMPMRSTGALIDTEILARIRRRGYHIVQRGVRHYPRIAGQQSGANLSVIFRAFKELFTLRKAILNEQEKDQ